MYAYDTMTLVGPGTWEAARGAVDAALTAVDLVASGAHDVAYALCRPPGHHATRQRLRRFLLPQQRSRRRARPCAESGHERVASSTSTPTTATGPR